MPLPPPPPENPSSTSFSHKRQFDTVFYPPPQTNFDAPSPTSSYQGGYMNNRGGYSNSFRGGGGGGYNRFPKRSRPYNYSN